MQDLNHPETTFSDIQDYFKVKAKSSIAEDVVRSNAFDAITQLIVEQQKPMIPTSYFAIAMTAINENLHQKANSQLSNESLLFILSMILQSLPPNVMILKGKESIECLTQLLNREKEDKMIKRLALNCISTIIAVQPPQILKEDNYINFITNIFGGVLSEDSKNRKSCITAIYQLLEKEGTEISTYIEDLFYKFCDKNLVYTTNTWRNIIYNIELIKFCAGKLKKKTIFMIFQHQLEVLKKGEPILTVSIYQSITPIIEKSKNKIPINLLTQILDKFVQMQPNIMSPEPLVAWTKAVSGVCSKIYQSNLEQTPSLMVSVINVLMKNFECPNKKVASCTTLSISKLINVCVKDSWIEGALVEYEKNDSNNEMVQEENQELTFLRFINTLEEGLSYKNLSSVPQIIHLIKHVFMRLKKHSYPLLSKILFKVSGIYESNTIPQLNEDIKHIYALAIKMMGPKLFLSILPLELDIISQDDYNSNQSTKHRAYLLPLLKESVRNTELIFFVAYFVPLIQKLTDHSKKLQLANRGNDAKDAEMVVTQMWSLLESFSLFPTDLQKSFPSIAKSMVNSLQTNSLIEPICNSLINIIKSQDAMIEWNKKKPQKQEKTNMEIFAKAMNDEDDDDSSYVPDDDNDDDGDYDDEEDNDDDDNENDSDLLPSVGQDSVDLDKEDLENSTYADMDNSESSDMYDGEKKDEKKQKKETNAFVIMASELLHPFTTEQAIENKSFISKFSGQIIPTLFNCFTKVHQSELELLLLKSIQRFFTVAPHDQINQFFRSVMISMIRTSYNEQVNQDTEKTQILSETTRIKKNRRKINVLSNLFVPYFNQENCLEMMSIIETVLNNKSDNSAKKVALHSLANLCKRKEGFALQFYKKISDFLSTTKANLNKKAKISCWIELSKYVETDQADAFIKKCLTESLMGTKDRSAKTRRRSSKLILALCELFVAKMDKKHSDFVVLLLGALAGKSPMIISATISAIGLIFYKNKKNIHKEFIHKVTESICIFLVKKSDNKQILKSIISYVQVLLKRGWLEKHLQVVITNILTMPIQAAGALRRNVRIFIERVLKKYPIEKIQKFIPPNQAKFVNKINKEIRKNKRQKEKEQDPEKEGKSKEGKQKEGKSKKMSEKMMYEQDDDSDEKDDDMKITGKLSAKLEDKYILEEGDDPIDFLSSDAITRISSVVPNQKREEERKKKKLEGLFPLKEGKFFIEDPEQRGDKYDEEDEGEMVLKSYGIALKREESSKKRKNTRDEEPKQKRPKRPNKIQKSGSDISSGRRYKAKNASGDVKRGKFDPFAYIRFDPTTLNKRNRNKSSKLFEDITRNNRKSAGKKKKNFNSKDK